MTNAFGTIYKEVLIEEPSLIETKKTKQPQDRNVVAIYNPFSRELLIHFVEYKYSVLYQFESEVEWVYINHPCITDQYLAVQLDYDECAELIIYYEEGEENDDARYIDGDSWHSGGSKDDNILIATNDFEFALHRAGLKNLYFHKYPAVSRLEVKK